MAQNLTKIARELCKALWRMFRKDQDPFKAPWPPGVDLRIVDTPCGDVLQLRPGAALPHDLYLRLMKVARQRASKQSASPCLN